MNPRLVLIELRKAVDTRSGRWLLIVTALLGVAFGVLQLMFEKDPEQRGLNGAFSAAHGAAGILLPVIGILLVTSEWSRRTVLTTFTLVPRRGQITAAKTGAAVLLALLASAAALVVAVLLNVLVPLWSDGAGGWDLDWGMVARATLVAVLLTVAGVAFGLLLMSSPLAIVLFFVAPTVFTVLGEVVTRLREPLRWIDVNLTLPELYLPDVSGREWAQAGTSVVVWAALPLLAGAVRTARRDVA